MAGTAAPNGRLAYTHSAAPASRLIRPFTGSRVCEAAKLPGVLSAAATVKAAAEPPTGEAEVSEPGMSKREASETRMEESGMSIRSARNPGGKTRRGNHS
jgi:hypothetical protein